MSRMARGNADYLSGTCTGFATTPLSMSVWVKFYDASVNNSLCGVGTLGSANNTYSIIMTGTDTVKAQEKDTASSAATTAAVPSIGVWHNYTAVFAAHNDRRIYFDGANKATDVTARTCGATTGAFILGDPVSGGGFNADYAHFALWNIALSDADVANLYARSPPCTQAANLVEYWPLYGNKNPEPSTQTANSLTVAGAQYSPSDPFANFSRLPYSHPVFLAA